MNKEEKDYEVFSYEGTNYKTLFTDKFRTHKAYQPDDPTKITAQIPGTMLKILVKEGQYINPSKCLFILEAMKMKNKVYASVSGRIRKIHIVEGQIVTKNQLLLELGEPETLLQKLLDKSQNKDPKPKKAPKEPREKKKSRESKKLRE